MTRRHEARGAAAALALALSLLLPAAGAGCDAYDVPPASTSREETTVTGTVRLNGKPVDNGTVEFNPANVRRPGAGLRRAAIGKDGRYTVRTLVGGNSVQVTCKELHTAKYRRFAENEFAFTAGPGENTFDIETAPGGPPARPAAGPRKAKRAPK
jgi:hypothetical protein